MHAPNAGDGAAQRAAEFSVFCHELDGPTPRDGWLNEHQRPSLAWGRGIVGAWRQVHDVVGPDAGVDYQNPRESIRARASETRAGI